MKPNGSYFCVGGSVGTLLQILLLGRWVGRRTGRKVRVLVVKPNNEDLVFMAGLCETGDIVPIIDRTYRLDEVPEAMRHLGEGLVKGKVVISVTDPATAEG